MLQNTDQIHPQAPPSTRFLRGFGYDPGLATELENYDVSEVLIPVRWEDLMEGPVGEYVEVVDIDPASGFAYDPLDLNDRHLLAQQGLAPSEGNPQFHQQMVYAVVMTTIQHFERALGREVFWSEMEIQKGNKKRGYKVIKRLRVYPHALREENAYYDSEKKALLFGYFPARPELTGTEMPGGMIFTCLSHDIIAHETTHAILDGMQRYYLEPSNIDALAFHEAFADLVALFQHFTYPEILKQQLQRARGNLEAETLLGRLAVQFGKATGGRGALREAIGGRDKDDKWVRREPEPDSLVTETEPHSRGALLVAAVFDAFLAIYRHRTADLLRIATGGSGVLPPGDIHPDLVNRLAKEAAKTAQHVLLMCIRAIDYCPPVDINFGDFLRALITADRDLVPEDSRNYRVAFIEAFRRWGIYPNDVRTLSVESLVWRPPEGDATAAFAEALRPAFYSNKLSRLWQEIINGRVLPKRNGMVAAKKLTRMEVAARLKTFRAGLHKQITNRAAKMVDTQRLGGNKRPFGFNLDRGTRKDYEFEIHQVRPVYRVGPDGRTRSDLLLQITQNRPGFLSPEKQSRENNRYNKVSQRKAPPKKYDFPFRGGGTFIIDLETFEIRYAIYKDILNERRLDEQREFLSEKTGTSLRELYFGEVRAGQRLAQLHSCDA